MSRSLLLPVVFAVAAIGSGGAQAQSASSHACYMQVVSVCPASASDPSLCAASGLAACDAMAGSGAATGDLLASLVVARLLEELFEDDAPTETPPAPPVEDEVADVLIPLPFPMPMPEPPEGLPLPTLPAEPAGALTPSPGTIIDLTETPLFPGIIIGG